jgi:hypothetical protein
LLPIKSATSTASWAATDPHLDPADRKVGGVFSCSLPMIVPGCARAPMFWPRLIRISPATIFALSKPRERVKPFLSPPHSTRRHTGE